MNRDRQWCDRKVTIPSIDCLKTTTTLLLTYYVPYLIHDPTTCMQHGPPLPQAFFKNVSRREDLQYLSCLQNFFVQIENDEVLIKHFGFDCHYRSCLCSFSRNGIRNRSEKRAFCFKKRIFCLFVFITGTECCKIKALGQSYCKDMDTQSK